MLLYLTLGLGVGLALLAPFKPRWGRSRTRQRMPDSRAMRILTAVTDELGAAMVICAALGAGALPFPTSIESLLLRIGSACGLSALALLIWTRVLATRRPLDSGQA